jgi:hypothetical protein
MSTGHLTSLRIIHEVKRDSRMIDLEQTVSQFNKSKRYRSQPPQNYLKTAHQSIGLKLQSKKQDQ